MTEEEIQRSIEEWENTIASLGGTIRQCKIKLDARKKQLQKVCAHEFHTVPMQSITYVNGETGEYDGPMMTICKKCGKLR